MALFDLYNLQNSPIGDFVVPWVFVFAMIFGLLEISKVFAGKKNINILISITIAFFAVATQDFRTLLWDVMPWAAGLLISLAFAKIIFDLFKGMSGEPKKWGDYVNLGTFALLFIFLGTIQNKVSSPTIDAEEIIWAVGFAALAVLMYKVIQDMEAKNA